MNSILLKNGKLIDRSENLLHECADVLIKDGMIAKIGPNIEEKTEVVIDCEGKFVSAGFIDAHVHCFPGCPGLGLEADTIGIKQGVTSLIDAGTAGPENFEQFIEQVVKPSRTRIFSSMNYSRKGLWVRPEGDDEAKWDLDLAEEVYRKHPDIIKAIKARASNTCVGKLGIKPIKAAKSLAERCGLPLYVHIGNPLPVITDTLEVMQKDDILTHCWHGKGNNLMVDGQIRKETQQARERGVRFDVGHGQESFSFRTMKQALAAGWKPDCISTDLHLGSFRHPVMSLAETMDKLIALGISLEEAVEDVTSQPARLFRLEKLGKLKEGYIADITVFHLENKPVTWTDSLGEKLEGSQSIKCDLAIVDGKIACEVSA